MGYKYVIYGAGIRGKRTLELVGKENVIAFVDSAQEKIGTYYCGIQIINVFELATIAEEYICVITPALQAEMIGKKLHAQGINNCLYLNDDIDRMFMMNSLKILSALDKVKSVKKVAIYKVCLSSLVIYSHLEKLNCNPILVLQEDDNENQVEYLKRFFCVSDNSETAENCDAIIYTEPYINNEFIRRIKNKVMLFNIKEMYEDALESAAEIKKYKHIHDGQRCFIVATGPSLRIADLEKLEANKEICISMNRIYNLFDSVQWRPNYYMIQDTKMIEDLSETIAELDLPIKFISGAVEKYWNNKQKANSVKFNFVNYVQMGNIPFFSDRVDKCVYEGMTVTYACLQMAVYMGFKEIYLLGLDHNYSKDVYSNQNHFVGYSADKSIRLNKVYIEQNELAYISAKRYAKEHGIQIYNATRGGKLEVFERVDFDSLF